MATKHLIARGIGFSPGSVKYIVGHGLIPAVAAAATLNQTDLDNIAQAVWSELRAGYTDSTTFGGWVQTKLLTVAKWLGLR